MLKASACCLHKQKNLPLIQFNEYNLIEFDKCLSVYVCFLSHSLFVVRFAFSLPARLAACRRVDCPALHAYFPTYYLLAFTCLRVFV